ncbi:MAG TPA: transposase, partial [Roseiarcus sp.]|nr:transposase [Roseiarcus sp.]
HHLSAWAGVCPGNHESAGRQKSGRARKGNIHLRTILVGAAISASRTKRSYLKDKFHRLKARRGGLRAAPAPCAAIFMAEFHEFPHGDRGESEGRRLGARVRGTRTLRSRREPVDLA